MTTWFKNSSNRKGFTGKFFSSLTPYLSYSPPVVLNFLSILQIHIPHLLTNMCMHIVCPPASFVNIFNIVFIYLFIFDQATQLVGS